MIHMDVITDFFQALFSAPESFIVIPFFVLVIIPSMFYLTLRYRPKDLLGYLSLVTLWILSGFLALISPLSILLYYIYHKLYTYWSKRRANKTRSDSKPHAHYGEALNIPPTKPNEPISHNNQDAPPPPECRLCKSIWTRSILFTRYVTDDPSVACTAYVWTSFFYIITKTIRDQELVDRIYSYYEDSTRLFVLANDSPDRVIQYVKTCYRRFRPVLNESGIDPRSPSGFHKLWELTAQWAFPNISLLEEFKTEFDVQSKFLVQQALDLFDLRSKDGPACLTEEMSCSKLISNLKQTLSLSNDQHSNLAEYVAAFSKSLQISKVMSIDNIDEFIDWIFLSGYIVPDFSQYHRLGMTVILTHTIYIPPHINISFQDWDLLRNRAMYSGILLTHDISAPSIDAWNSEMASFLDDLFVVGDDDAPFILERIVQVAEEGLQENVNLPEYIAWMAELPHKKERDIITEVSTQIEIHLRIFAQDIAIATEEDPSDGLARFKRLQRRARRIDYIRKHRRNLLFAEEFNQ